jgi:1-carboxybiuret hydrolase subunit AtzG-like protein
MSTKPADLDKWIDTMSEVLRLPVADAHRTGVKANLKTAAKMAALLEKTSLSDHAEPAPVFRA